MVSLWQRATRAEDTVRPASGCSRYSFSNLRLKTRTARCRDGQVQRNQLQLPYLSGSTYSVSAWAALLVGCGAASVTLAESANLSDPHEHRRMTPLDLLTLRDLSGLSVSPDGQLFAVLVRQARLATNDYRQDWWVVETESGGTSIHIGDAGKPIFRMEPRGTPNGSFITPAPKWSPDGKSFVYMALTQGVLQLWRASANGQVQQQLTFGKEDIDEFKWSNDGKKLFFSQDSSEEDRHISIQREGKRGYLYDDRFVPFESDTPLVKAWINPPVRTPNTGRAVRVLELDGLVTREATAEEKAEFEGLPKPNHALNRARARLVKQSPVGNSIAWLEPNLPEDPLRFQAETLMVRGSGGEIRVCHAPECVIDVQSRGASDLWWSGDAIEIYFMRREGVNYGKTGLYAWNPILQTVQTILVTDDLITDCSIVQSKAVCFFEAPTQPRKVVSISLDSGSVSTLFDPNPWIRNISFTDVTKLEWKSDLGAEAFGYLVEPADYVPGRRYPLVITTYAARGFLRGGVGDEYPVHVLAAQGFMVLAYNQPRTWDGLEGFRSSEKRSRARRENGLHARVRQASIDKAVSLLDEMGVVDIHKVGLSGLSSGSEAVHYALHQMENLAAAAASGPATMDASYYFLGGGAVREALNLWHGFPDFSKPGAWRELSVSYNVKDVEAPILINAADSEYLLSLEMIENFRRHNRPVELYVFPDEYHVKYQPVHRYNIYKRNVQWFRFWLKGEIASEPVDSEQYTRWAMLCRQNVENRKASNEQVIRANADSQPCSNGVGLIRQDVANDAKKETMNTGRATDSAPVTRPFPFDETSGSQTAGRTAKSY